MLEQLLDLCRLYPLGRFIRNFNKGGYGSESKRKAIAWANDYAAEIHKGIILLQREQYLQDRRMEIVATLQRQQQQQQQEEDLKITDLEFFDELEQIDVDIRQVQQLCRAHEERMRVQWANYRDNSFSRHVVMAQKAQYRLIAGRQPYAWREARNQCAESGGCCGRKCRCCEKPLKVSVEYGPAVFGLRMEFKSGVYGHCTAECGCCRRYKGSYKPDPWFENASRPT